MICFKDNRSEALEYDTHAIRVYKKVEEPDEKLKLVGQVPIECSFLLDFFLKADSSNKLTATVEGKESLKSGWSFQESSYAVGNNLVKLTSYIVS